MVRVSSCRRKIRSFVCEPVGAMEEEVKRLMKEHEVDDDVAEKAQELIDEGLDEDEAIEIAEEL